MKRFISLNLAALAASSAFAQDLGSDIPEWLKCAHILGSGMTPLSGPEFGDQIFSLKLQPPEPGRVTHLFWIDGKSYSVQIPLGTDAWYRTDFQPVLESNPYDYKLNLMTYLRADSQGNIALQPNSGLSLLTKQQYDSDSNRESRVKMSTKPTVLISKLLSPAQAKKLAVKSLADSIPQAQGITEDSQRKILEAKIQDLIKSATRGKIRKAYGVEHLTNIAINSQLNVDQFRAKLRSYLHAKQIFTIEEQKLFPKTQSLDPEFTHQKICDLAQAIKDVSKDWVKHGEDLNKQSQGYSKNCDKIFGNTEGAEPLSISSPANKNGTPYSLGL